MRRRGQVKFGETIGIIIIVFIVIIVGFVWYNQVQTKNIAEIYEKDQRDRAFEKYHYIVNLHLIHNSERGDIDEDFDLSALLALSDFSQTDEGREYLRRSLGESLVTVSILENGLDDDGNPIFEPSTPIVLYDNEPDLTDQTRLFNKEIFRTTIPVVTETGRRTDIGLLELTNYIEVR